jgi:hypothetical protein
MGYHFRLDKLNIFFNSSELRSIYFLIDLKRGSAGVGASALLPRRWLRVKIGGADHADAGLDQHQGDQLHRTVLFHVVFLEGGHQARILRVGLGEASFRSHLAMGTLAVRLTLPPVVRVEDFHLQVGAPCRAHK